MAEFPETVYWLTLIYESGIKLNLLKPIIQRWCIADQRPMAELFELSALEWSSTFGLNDEDANRALAAREKLPQQAKIISQGQTQGLEPLIRTDPRYPKRFIQTLPPAQQPLILWAKGNLQLLNEANVAMLGNEAPDETTNQFLDELMSALVGEDIGLVSGYGRGLDRATFETMLQTTDGRAVVVLPMGISAFIKTTNRLEQAAQAGQIVMMSPFAPNTPYQDRLAQARNLLIDHLALSLLILHPNDDAQSRAKSALNRGLPVFVSLNDNSNNRALIEQGALLLTDAGEVVEMVQQALIDGALQADSEETTPVAEATPLPPVLPSDSNDDYGLRFEDVDPIDGDEALEILSLGGEIPESLRKRLEGLNETEDEA